MVVSADAPALGVTRNFQLLPPPNPARLFPARGVFSARLRSVCTAERDAFDCCVLSYVFCTLARSPQVRPLRHSRPEQRSRVGKPRSSAVRLTGCKLPAPKSLALRLTRLSLGPLGPPGTSVTHVGHDS
ncbi:hypothetical protein HJG60_012154 [Phyllostomus discolor]|uniref:Uncharacterized protein n=1 Tax=Phyllostomus discolor TaxID=89673 RepID=A0A833ZDV7_9CHIR|nr:hypothetical protein HJG60_012154 [Phyllostomus discolor]